MHSFYAVLGAVGQASAKEKTSVKLGRFPQTFSECASIGPTISHITFMVGFRKSVEIWSTPGMRSFLALERAGFVCTLELARMYKKGEGVRADSIQAYRWYTVLMTDQPVKDLRATAYNKR